MQHFTEVIEREECDQEGDLIYFCPTFIPTLMKYFSYLRLPYGLAYSWTHRVDVEPWKSRKQRKRGVYVSRLNKPFEEEESTKQQYKLHQHHSVSIRVQKIFNHKPTDNYRAIVSFINIANVHWKFLYINAADSTVYGVDPARNNAAKRLREYFNMRTICYGKSDWVNIKWKGGVMERPFQRDGSSCGIIVIKMAKAVMESFPQRAEMTFETARRVMADERKHLALELLEAS
ncbi:uncharacterized protein LOC122769683 isoform X2, partial [Scomber scombrus]